MSLNLPWLSFLQNLLHIHFSSGSHTISASIVSEICRFSKDADLRPYIIGISGSFVKDQKADIIAIAYDAGGIVGEPYNTMNQDQCRYFQLNETYFAHMLIILI